MKHCNSCGLDKPLSAFAKNKAKKDGLQNECKSCKNKRNKHDYRSNSDLRQATRQRSKERRRKSRELFLEYIKLQECQDCGNSDYRVLQFDHVEHKRKNVSELVCEGYAWETILAEIKKCEIVCANCHIIRTLERANSYRR